MQEHVLYYFSGTGNSLRAALSIQKALDSCSLISMGGAQEASSISHDAAKSIGFVFPCYFGGLPQRVKEFIEGLDISKTPQPYLYIVLTYGAMTGSAIGQAKTLLEKKGLVLSYAAELKTFANYVVLYDMSEKVAQKTAETKAELQPIIANINKQKTSEIKKPSKLALAYNHITSKGLAAKDRHFIVHESCTHCELCQKVCPVNNIVIEDGKPRWQGRCEQCMACIQWCPERSIDYGDKTEGRGRYTNPEITSKMFIAYLNGEGITN